MRFPSPTFCWPRPAPNCSGTLRKGEVAITTLACVTAFGFIPAQPIKQLALTLVQTVSASRLQTLPAAGRCGYIGTSASTATGGRYARSQFVSTIREQDRWWEQRAEENRTQPIVVRFTGRESEMDHDRVNLARQVPPRATHSDCWPRCWLHRVRKTSEKRGRRSKRHLLVPLLCLTLQALQHLRQEILSLVISSPGTGFKTENRRSQLQDEIF